MKDSKTSPALSRRRVFAAGGTVGALAAAAAVLPLAQQAPQASAEPAPAKPDGDAGYRVTEHVLRYYQTARV